MWHWRHRTTGPCFRTVWRRNANCKNRISRRVALAQQFWSEVALCPWKRHFSDNPVTVEKQQQSDAIVAFDAVACPSRVWKPRCLHQRRRWRIRPEQAHSIPIEQSHFGDPELMSWPSSHLRSDHRDNRLLLTTRQG